MDKTENSRVSYPLDFIARHEPSGRGTHPKHIIFLTCDAFGVLPPVSRLTVEQALYHFLSGYTAKVAGTERGITEPQATFSAGFGAAFLTLHPTQYADLLREKLQKHASKLYLVNTGWIGGPYGVGRRMSIRDTRACIDAILDDSIATGAGAGFVVDPVFGFEIPTAVGAVAPEVLNPRQAWADPVSARRCRRVGITHTADKCFSFFRRRHMMRNVCVWPRCLWSTTKSTSRPGSPITPSLVRAFRRPLRSPAKQSCRRSAGICPSLPLCCETGELLCDC